MGLYTVFKDVNKDFNSVGGEGLWKILAKVGRPGKIIQIIGSFHNGMVGLAVKDGAMSDQFPVNNRTKQGWVIVPLIFSTVFSAMLHNAFKDCERGVRIWFCTDESVFNLQRLNDKTKFCG